LITYADLLGAWRMLNWRMRRDGVDGPGPMGEGATGLLFYGAPTGDGPGQMAAVLQAANWPGAPANAADVNGFLTYSGAWALAGADVRHDITLCSYAPWIGRTMIRAARLDADGHLHLLTAPETSRSGAVYQQALIWRR
jgi:hypothetical protein